MESKLALLIEFWFPFSQINDLSRLGLWCDGIPFLRVRKFSRTAFAICGVGYFPTQLTAFETEWYFENRRDQKPQRIRLRLDHLAREKEQKFRAKDLESFFDARPRTNADWMVAVELT